LPIDAEGQIFKGHHGRPYCEGARDAAFRQPDQTARPSAPACGGFEDREGECTLIWPVSKDPEAIHVFRKDHAGVRGHESVSLKELAAIVVPSWIFDE
jgi:hypothetical protein